MKVVCTGGGTGGHTLPVLAVIRAIESQHPSAKIVFIGSRFGIESRLVPKMGFKYYGISTGKFRRYHRLKVLNLINPSTFFLNFRDFFRFLRGIGEARSILRHEKPDVIFAKGGFVSLPVGVAAKILGIPIVVHESDVVMGLANRKLSSIAKIVCVSFPLENYKNIINDEKIIETGNPVREDILKGDGERLIKELGFVKEKKTILVLGGSQGSRFLNELIFEKLDSILRKWQLIWVTGGKDIEATNYQLEEIDQDLMKSLKVYGFLTTELADAYAAADLVISRAGSNVLFELAALAKPAILIPFSEATNSHQLENAKLFSRSGAAYLFRQESISSEKLIHQISYLFENPNELESMQKAMKNWFNSSSADRVASEIIKAGEKRLEETRES